MVSGVERDSLSQSLGQVLQSIRYMDKIESGDIDSNTGWYQLCDIAVVFTKEVCFENGRMNEHQSWQFRMRRRSQRETVRATEPQTADTPPCSHLLFSLDGWGCARQRCRGHGLRLQIQPFRSIYLSQQEKIRQWIPQKIKHTHTHTHKKKQEVSFLLLGVFLRAKAPY